MSTTPPLFAGLLDDAAMFPPGNASPADAISEHLRYRNAWFGGLVGPLLVDSRRWEEFADAHAQAGSPRLSVTVVGVASPPSTAPVGVRLHGFELPVSSLPLPDPGTPYLVAAEITGAADRSKLLTAIAERRATGQRIIAKYRTGGTSLDAFPSEQELAQAVSEAAESRVPMKLTAGLHSAVRCTDRSTGFEHHGFLNVMVAVAVAVADGVGDAPPDRPKSMGTVVATLAQRDPGPLVEAVRSWTPAEVVAVREAFVSFGCCGLEEPVADLVSLELLASRSR